jgi:cytochrome c-type biogenesis protein CcmH
VRPAVVLLTALAVATPALAADPPSPAGLEAELVCPTCQTTLDQSHSPVAQRMKAFIRRRIAAGATASEIKAELVDQFGPGVLATPGKGGFDLLAWVLPLSVLALGAVAVGGLAWSWSMRRGEPIEPETPPDPELDRRLDEELARFGE